MTWIDVSVPLDDGMVVYEGDPPVRVARVSSVEEGDLATVRRLELGSHTGTHVDAPAHFIAGGAGVDELPLDALVGEAAVVDLSAHADDLDAAALRARRVPGDGERVLLKTRNADLWDAGGFHPDYVGVTEDGARELVGRGVRLVGIDYLSIAPSGDPVPAHRVLLEAGVVILEGLDLRAVAEGPHELVCLPLRLRGGDGAPARALLRPLAGAGARGRSL
jgi:arylformamidase